MTTTRKAGLGLVVYVIGTLAGFLGVAAPGGDYEPDAVARYVSSGHFWPAFGLGYLGALSALGLLVFGYAARSLWPRVADVVWPLMVAGTAISVVGGFLVTGVVVAFAEGGAPVSAGVPHPVVYVFGEVGNLLALCGPAFFVGVAALVLARAAGLPMWLRVWAVAAGLCGILLPFYFTIPVYVLWVLVFGIWLAARREREGAAVGVGQLQESLV